MKAVWNLKEQGEKRTRVHDSPKVLENVWRESSQEAVRRERQMGLVVAHGRSAEQEHRFGLDRFCCFRLRGA